MTFLTVVLDNVMKRDNDALFVENNMARTTGEYAGLFPATGSGVVTIHLPLASCGEASADITRILPETSIAF